MSDPQVSTAVVATAVIDVNQDASIVAWCARFGVAEDVLRAAIAMVGPMPAAVGFYVQGRHINRRTVTDEIKREIAGRRFERLARKERARETARRNGLKSAAQTDSGSL
jgi:hypothetical protein